MAERPSRLAALLEELRRRRVLHVAAVYAVVGWLVVQVAVATFPALYLPSWGVTLVVLLVLLGFPVTLVGAWAFELTPEGLKRTGEDDPDAPPARLRRQTVPILLLVLALTGAGGWLAWRMLPHPGAPPSEAGSEPLDPTRVAVLYLDDHSRDMRLGAEARGFTEALIRELSRVEGLSVVSRNGVKAFREADVPLDSVVRATRAGSLVEGSLEEGPDGLIRVEVRLIDGATGTAVEGFTREAAAGGVLGLRDDIVLEVARLLRRRLGEVVALRTSRAGTESAESWRLFHRGRERMELADTLRLSGAREASERFYLEADSLLALASTRDPDWNAPRVSRGWVAYGRARLAARGVITSFDEGRLREGLERVRAALERDPEDASAHELRGTLLFQLSRLPEAEDPGRLLEGAEGDLARAVALDPERAVAWLQLARLRAARGRLPEARIALARSREADPFLASEREHVFVACQLALELGETERALELARRGRRLFPDNPAFDAAQLTVLAGPGVPAAPADSAWRLLGAVAASQPGGRWPAGEMLVSAVLVKLGLADSARAAAARSRAVAPGDPFVRYYGANVEQLLGRPRAAVAELAAYLAAFPDERGYVARDWWWSPLEDRPDFLRLVEEPGSGGSAGDDPDPAASAGAPGPAASGEAHRENR